MANHVERSSRFLDLHHGEQPLLLPNPWERGVGQAAGLARLPGPGHHQQRLRGHLGRPDGQVTRKEVIEHAA